MDVDRSAVIANCIHSPSFFMFMTDNIIEFLFSQSISIDQDYRRFSQSIGDDRLPFDANWILSFFFKVRDEEDICDFLRSLSILFTPSQSISIGRIVRDSANPFVGISWLLVIIVFTYPIVLKCL